MAMVLAQPGDISEDPQDDPTPVPKGFVGLCGDFDFVNCIKLKIRELGKCMAIPEPVLNGVSSARVDTADGIIVQLFEDDQCGIENSVNMSNGEGIKDLRQPSPEEPGWNFDNKAKSWKVITLG
ncbi:hypothetical protein FBU30_002119 [Linnemannia zychae]|nr:hypothetical protein FBU30_002119 [Linnemannia zychae]